MRKARWLASAIAGVAIIGATLVAAVAPAGATPSPGHKVTICHATDSATNPYVEITVDIASSGYVKAGHADHIGPVPTSQADVDQFKADGIHWGDVIPAYHYDPTNFDYPGLNVPEGQFLLDNGCAIPETPPRLVQYKLVRRMSLLTDSVTLKAGLTPSISCGDVSGVQSYIVEFSDGTIVTLPTGDSKNGSILRIRSEGIVLIKVRASDIC